MKAHPSNKLIRLVARGVGCTWADGWIHLPGKMKMDGRINWSRLIQRPPGAATHHSRTFPLTLYFLHTARSLVYGSHAEDELDGQLGPTRERVEEMAA